MKYPTTQKNGKREKRMKSPESVNAVVKSICDIMRRSNCAGALQYVPELTWILFLRILDEQETAQAAHAKALGLPFTPSLSPPYRWQDWAAPDSPRRKDKSAEASVWRFVHEDLLPTLKGLKNGPGATPRQRVISQIMAGVDRSRVDSEKNFCDILDKVHQISAETVDDTHVFTLSQVYEGLLLKMGEKGNDGGQFFTPREIIRVMVRVVDPEIGKTVYDPGCGTGGFLAQAFEYMRDKAGQAITSTQLDTLRHRTFYGREKDNAVYPIALANLVLHGIDEPHIWHGNSLSGEALYAGLFDGAPQFYDYVLMNPPFGGKEGKTAQTPFEYKTGATQVLFLQSVLKSMKAESHCGIVLDEGVLFRTSETAFGQTKRKLLEECDVYCIVSLPGGVFTSAGAGVKTNLVFFVKGSSTEKIWYYDLSDIKVGKKTPLTRAHFDDFFKLLPTRADSARSWTVDFLARHDKAMEEARPFRQKAQQLGMAATKAEEDFRDKKENKTAAPAELTALEQKWKQLVRDARENASKGDAIEDAVYDLKAVNPNHTAETDRRTPAELLIVIAEQGRKAAAALARLKDLIEGSPSGAPAMLPPERTQSSHGAELAHPPAGVALQTTVFTVGHSDHSLEAFLRLLRQHDIQAVADVRSSPYSRHVPHFNKESISSFLSRNGVDYVFLGRELGARRSERSCYVEGRAQYERIAEMDVFREGIQRICKGAKKYRLAVMCTEKDPLRCHRCVLVSRTLVEAGVAVQHIHSDGHLETQSEVEERMICEVGIAPDFFDGGNDRSILVARAYREQGLRLAVREQSEDYETTNDRVHEEER